MDRSAVDAVGDTSESSDTLGVGFEGEHLVRDTDIEHLHSNGQVTLRAVLTPEEADAVRTPIGDAIAQCDALDPTDTEGDVYRRAFDQHMNLWRLDARVERFVRSPRLGALAARLLGVERVRLYHDQALFKRAGGGHTPWHQDKHYWPLDTDLAITMWMPLVDVTPAMGELHFAHGSHHAGAVSESPISDEADREIEAYLERSELSVVPTGPMRAGDASFHLAWTLHSATANVTDTDREVMTVIWFADGARVTEPANEGQRKDLLTWLPELKPGDLAASSINPVC